MATGFSKKIIPQRVSSPNEEPAEDDLTEERPSRLRTVLLLASILLLLALAPTLIGASPLRNHLLNLALASEQGTIHSGGATLGWFSSLSVRDLEVRDAEGEVLLSAPAIRLNKSLIGLLFDSARLGTIRVEQPQLWIKLRQDGSNVEDFIAPWLEPSDSESTTRVALDLEISGGTLYLEDQVAQQNWELREWGTTLGLSTLEPTPLVLKTTAAVPAVNPPGLLEVELTLPADESEAAQVKLLSDRFPLAMIQTLVARYVPETRLVGAFTSDVSGTWQGANRATVAGEALVSGLRLKAQALGQDEIVLEQLRVPCELTYADGNVTIEQLTAECDLGHLTVSGRLRTASVTPQTLSADFAHQPLEVHGHIDVVRLSEMLPDTLSIRDEMRLTSGDIELAFSSRQDAGTHRWNGRIVTQQLAGVSGGRPIRWEKPIELILEAHQAGEAVVVDRLTCQSEFLQITAGGTREQLTGRVHFDLNALVDQLEQFVDFHGWQLSGMGDVNFQWSCSPTGAFQAGALVGLNHFQIAGPGRPAWVEEKLSLQLAADGGLDKWTLRNVRNASLKIVAADDQLDLVLREPVHNVAEKTVWPLHVRLQGELARWLPRVQPVVTLPEMELAGNCDLTGSVNYSSDQIQLNHLQTLIQNFSLHGFGLHILEPKVELAGQGRWNMTESRLDVPTLTLASSALSVRAEQLALKLPSSAPPALSGTLALQGTLDRLQAWCEDPQRPATYRVIGEVSGHLRLARAGGETTAQIHLDGNRLRLVEQTLSATQATSRLVWTEQELALDGSATYRETSDQLQLHKVQLTSQTLGLTGSGTINELTTAQAVEMAGTLNYEMAQLMQLLEPYVGKTLRLEGRDTTPFQIKGRLTPGADDPPAHWSQRLAGSLALGWKQGQIYGLPIGPARIETQLGQGAVALAPFKIALADGQFASAPRLQLDPGPMQLTLPAGPLLQQVRMTPEMCDQGLKYIAPILADATRTEGRMSLDLEGGRVPLDAPQRADVAGRLTIHHVDVMPGPLAQEFILLGKQIEAIIHRQPPPLTLNETRALLKIENQNVPFRLVEGRVYHQGIAIKTGDVVIHTHGSVGLDQTLSVVAEVPIQDRWLTGTDPVINSLRGQKIQVLISGTLRQPRLDRRSIETLAAQLLRTAAQEAIRNELGKQLDKLFGPKP